MELRESAVEFKYGKLAAGEVNFIFRADVAAGAYKTGELLETADGLTWTKATDVKVGGMYAVVAGDVTLTDAGEVVCYKEGYFNANILTVNGAKATANMAKILKTKNIFVTAVAE